MNHETIVVDFGRRLNMTPSVSNVSAISVLKKQTIIATNAENIGNKIRIYECLISTTSIAIFSILLDTCTYRLIQNNVIPIQIVCTAKIMIAVCV